MIDITKVISYCPKCSLGDSRGPKMNINYLSDNGSNKITAVCPECGFKEEQSWIESNNK